MPSSRHRGLPSAPLAIFATAIACLCVLAAPRAHAQPTIGLYTDASGVDCGFLGNAPGAFSAYVVVRPDINGFTGVRFAAPVPACLGSVYVNETPLGAALTLGESQTGVSIALPGCTSDPVAVLQINYFRTSTQACCPYTIVPDPIVGYVEATDCWFNSLEATALTSRFNADASCACAGNTAPLPPMTPYPPDYAPFESVLTHLTWEASDYDNNIAEYDVYLGTDPEPALAAAQLVEPFYQPAQLEPLTAYYWRVVVRDAQGLETTGPVWHFTTRALNSPPYAPSNPQPLNGAGGVSTLASLTWAAHDVDGDAVECYLYFGTASSPPFLVGVAVGLDGLFSYTPSLAYATTYYWRVVARDATGQETSGPVWWFTTRPENYPPTKPTYYEPANNAVNVSVTPLLRWSSSDTDGDVINYDVYLGTTTPPALVSQNQVPTSYTPPAPLAYGTGYYWRVVARDQHGAETAGDIRYFTTRPGNFAPTVPSNPTPANASTGRPVNQSLAWVCSDADGDPVTYDVYFGTASPPPLAASNLPNKMHTPGPLAFLTTYYWRVVARDSHGLESQGPVWSFSTKANQPPNAPTSPTPSNGSTGRPLNQTLAWQCTEPDGQAMTFDVYFGTSSSPPLAAEGLTTKSYAPGALAMNTRYYWRVVARDETNLTTSGASWYFTTRGDTPPSVPSSPSPGNGTATSSVTPTLTWYSSDADGQPLTYEVAFGTTSPPPVVATGLTARSYAPGTLTMGTIYYWRIVVSDGINTVGGPTWSFLVAQPGDANFDGSLTLADAACAFQVFLGNAACAGTYGQYMANVDCNPAVTPRDARCIHRKVLDGSCVFCGSPAAAAEDGERGPAGPTRPAVFMTATWEVGDTLCVRLAMGGVPYFSAFGFPVYSDGGRMVRAVRRGATGGFTAFGSGVPGTSVNVGGYHVDGVSTSGYVDLIDLYFLRSGTGSVWVQIPYFVDDLAEAYPVSFVLGGGSLPVLISRFDAVAAGGGVRVSWELASDETMERFTLMRRETTASQPVSVAEGPVTGVEDSYLDLAVEAGKTYRYELVIHTTDGDVFRSREATVTLAAQALVLHQNHPNPFNPQTTIRYDLPVGAAPVPVRLWILDLAGRVVRTLVDERQGGGTRSVVWEGRDDRGQTVSSGVYFYVLDVDGERLTRKLVLLK